MDEQEIQSIVQSVLNTLKQEPMTEITTDTTYVKSSPASNGPETNGVFNDMEKAIEAGLEAFDKYLEMDLDARRAGLEAVRQCLRDHVEEFSRMIVEETGMGVYQHKIMKHLNIADNTPGVEDIQSDSWVGSRGTTIEEYVPFGLLGAITPVRYPVPTIARNALCMLAGGNTVVFNAHPRSKKVCAYAIELFNQALTGAGLPPNLLTIIREPSMDSAQTMFAHPEIPLLCITGGPGVVKAAMHTNKKVIAAGPGNPPVVVDETVDLAKTVGRIIEGAAFDNNILCIAEKQVFVVNDVFDDFMAEMGKAGAVMLNVLQIDKLGEMAFQKNEKGQLILNRELVGKSADKLADLIHLNVPDATILLYGEIGNDHVFVKEEQMMPFLPIIRARDFEDAVELAYQSEHGYGHTAIIHSNNMERVTYFIKRMRCCINMVNGPTTEALNPIVTGGTTTHTVASPTGEGVTTPKSFTKVRRIAISNSMTFK